MIVDLNNLHAILRQKTITICELPDEDVAELDAEVAEASDGNVTQT